MSHLHLPVRIIVDERYFEFTGLAQCHCRRVAHLHRWDYGPWPRHDYELSGRLRWELAEDWRDPEEEETELFANGIDELAPAQDFSTD